MRTGSPLGHTHKPWYRAVEGIHFLNTGSVGKPKDGHCRAGYMLLSMGEGDPKPEFIRVDYDIERAMAGIRSSELPDEFAGQLRTGGMPGSPQEYRTVPDNGDQGA